MSAGPAYETILYETSEDHVATITLNRPEVLNAFDRKMCEEMREVWKRVKDDPDVHAVVLRAAGERAFCTGLDTKKSYGQPDDIWNHEDPGELLSPKWQQVWKPVVCAVQGLCTAGALYFLNEADVVICSPEATFFDSHVTFGLVSALEPVGLMRKVGLAETLRIAFDGQRRAGHGRDGPPHQPRDRDRSARGPVGPRPRHRRSDRPKAEVRHAGHGPGHLGVARQALPRRDAAEPRVHAAGQPHRPGRGCREGRRPARPEVPVSDTAVEELSARIAQVLALDPAAQAFEFEHTWHTWGEVQATADAVAPQVVPGARVGVMLRNRPAHIGLLLGLLRAGACVVVVNPGRGDERVKADLAALEVPILAGTPDDLAAFGPSSTASLRLSSPRLGLVEVEGTPVDLTDHRAPGVAVEMLTSGTTGPPKRVPLTYETFMQVLVGAKHYEKNAGNEVRLRSGVVIVNSPLVHLAGLFRVLQCVNDGRSFCLLERFEVDTWADAVRRHRPRTVSLVPAALRMVLDADLDRDDLSSVRSVISGTAPLSPDDADAFHEKYGVPVLIAYAATEFGGGVAGWNLADHEAYWAQKRGSVGRAHAGCELRVVDAVSGEPLGPDQEGLLEVKARQIDDGREWTRTTDLARIDADGFLFILGRADQAIIRGGFKVLPETVKEALERDPRVLGAAVVGRDDERLGAVPVAAVELRRGAAPVSGAELLGAASGVLARYELPEELRVVDALPRTPSGKVDLAAVRELFEVEH